MRRLDINTNYLVVGIPRSGTSMTMQLLHYGGLPIWYEPEKDQDFKSELNWGEPDYDPNPNGYFYYRDELHPLAELLETQKGKFFKTHDLDQVKILPSGSYKIILIERDPAEVKQSQEITWHKYRLPEKFVRAWADELAGLKNQLTTRADVELLVINYNRIMADPAAELDKIKNFLPVFNTEHAIAVINPKLYRNRS